MLHRLQQSANIRITNVDQAPELDVPLLEVFGVAVEDPQVLIPVRIVPCLVSSSSFAATLLGQSLTLLGKRRRRLEQFVNRSKKCQWYISVKIPDFPNLSPISSFRDPRDQCSMFYPCMNLWHLGSHFWFKWIFLCIFPCFPHSCLCPHSGTMTCSVCLCQTIMCSCVRCILVENVHHRTQKHPSPGLDDPFPLPDERELTASTSMGSECPRAPVSLGLK